MSLWDTLLIPADKLQQLHTDAAAARPTHAWLFTGATGAPHREAAKVFAAALLCDQPDPQNRGCGQCKGLSLIHISIKHLLSSSARPTTEAGTRGVRRQG